MYECQYAFDLIRQHGEAQKGGTLQSMQAQAAGKTLYALVHVPNRLLAAILALDPLVFEDLNEQILGDLQHLPDWMEFVGIYAMDKKQLDQLHAKMHKQGLEEDINEDDGVLFRHLAPMLLSRLAELQGEAPPSNNPRRKPRTFDD